jgi:hypothetical protein
VIALRASRRHSLPPLHAPCDREVVAHVGPWEVRRHAAGDIRFAYLASRSLLHLQLWQPARRISVLTPSRLTGDRFEIAACWRRAWVSTWHGVLAQLPDLQLPSGAELAALTTWLVCRARPVATTDSRGDDR